MPRVALSPQNGDRRCDDFLVELIRTRACVQDDACEEALAELVVQPA